MIKMENGGHFGRHLQFWKKLQGDSWGLLVCYLTHIPRHVLKNSACYEIFPGYNYCSWTMVEVHRFCYRLLLMQLALVTGCLLLNVHMIQYEFAPDVCESDFYFLYMLGYYNNQKTTQEQEVHKFTLQPLFLLSGSK